MFEGFAKVCGYGSVEESEMFNAKCSVLYKNEWEYFLEELLVCESFMRSMSIVSPMYPCLQKIEKI